MPGGDPLSDPNLQPTLRTIERARAQANRLLNNAPTNFRRAKDDERMRNTPDLSKDFDLKPRIPANVPAKPTADPLLTPEVMAAFAKLQADPKANALDYPVSVAFMAAFKERKQKREQTNPIARAAAA